MKNLTVVVMIMVMSFTSGCSSCDRGFSAHTGKLDTAPDIQSYPAIPVTAPRVVRISGSMFPETKYVVMETMRNRGWIVSEKSTSFELQLQRTRRGDRIRYVAILYQNKRVVSMGAGEAVDWSRIFPASDRFSANIAQRKRSDAEIDAATQAVMSLRY
jgi:hypothetical protein